MSLIGSLEQFDLSNILRRIEVFSKTGLLVVKQGNLWVELYFRQGQLVCVGPMRSNVTLIDRLVQAKLISPQTLPQIMQVVSAAGSNETQMAVMLINEGYLSREILRAWSAHETSQIMRTVFSWQNGEIHFEEDYPTPTDRLLVALSVSMLLDALPASSPQIPSSRSATVSTPSTNEVLYPSSQSISTSVPDTGRLGQVNAAQLRENQPPVSVPTTESLHASRSVEQSPSPGTPPAPNGGNPSGLLSASQLIDNAAFTPSGTFNAARLIEETPQVSFAPAAPVSTRGLFGSEVETPAPAQSFLTPPQPVPNPLPPACIDTSFMTPELVLTTVDLSSLREHNPQVQLTPDQWRLFALIDGQVSLQMICQALMAPSEVVCKLAGELMAIGLVAPLVPSTGSFHELPQVGMNSGPTQPAAPSYPYAAPLQSQPQPAGSVPMPFAVPIETQSQWGNGNNGATFMVGGGWVLSSRQGMPQPGQSGAAYAPVGGFR